MSDLDATTTAKATLHLKVIRADGRVEEYDVAAATDITPEQVRALIAQHDAQGPRCGLPATAAVLSPGIPRRVLMCEHHLQQARDAEGPAVTAEAALGTCMALKGE